MSGVRSLIPPANMNLIAWPTPDEAIVRSMNDFGYFKRKQAVQMYADNCPYTEIKNITGIKNSEVRRIVKRCVTADGEGDIFGFRALTKNIRVSRYTRDKSITSDSVMSPEGWSGAMTRLLELHPQVGDKIHRLLFKGEIGGHIHEASISYTSLHAEFISELRALGFTNFDWPFCTVDRGYKTLVGYCKKLKDAESRDWIRVRHGDDIARRSGVGRGYRALLPRIRGFSHVQLDFHTIDATSIIRLDNGLDVPIPIVLPRWSIGALVEEFTNAVLGFIVVLSQKANTDDVIHLVDVACRKDMPDLGNGTELLDHRPTPLPQDLMMLLRNQGFASLKLDNAMEHVSNGVIDRIVDAVGCAVNFGPVRAWWRRPTIERVFGRLEQLGPQRIASTNGNGPLDDRKKDPAGAAIKYDITLSKLEALLYETVRYYNETENEGVNFATPVQLLHAETGSALNKYFPQFLSRASLRDGVLQRIHVVCKVRGSMKKNVAPYVQHNRQRYTNAQLSRHFELIGKEVLLQINRENDDDALGAIIRTGQKLGLLVRMGRYLSSPMSVRNRTYLNRAGMALRRQDERPDTLQAWQQSIAATEFKKRAVMRKNGQKRPSKLGMTLARNKRAFETDKRSASESFPSEVVELISQPNNIDPFEKLTMPSRRHVRGRR